MHDDEVSSVSRVRQELKQLEAEAKEAFAQALPKDKIESLRVHFLGKKGKVSNILRLMGELNESERPKVGKIANEVRDQILAFIETGLAGQKQVERSKKLASSIDISLPGRVYDRGRKHPITETAEAIMGVLRGLGFDLASGPEIEHDFYNFEALNMPHDHPAREMQDTFYINEEVVLRTHVSPVQIRAMLSLKNPPIRIASAGRVYRRDEDVTHSPVFHQVEGLYVDGSVSFAELKGTLQSFVEQVFSPKVKIRLRPSYFPFTEPSAEVDISCFICDGRGCRLCKETGFIEILGAGMVDPEVFKAAGLDPEKVSGFAFGIGIERVAMLRHGISDIRLFYENDLRFLSQF